MSGVVLYKNINAKTFKITKAQPNKYAKTQLTGFVNYDGGMKCIVQTHTIKNKYSPIAKLDDFHANDYECSKDTRIILDIHNVPDDRIFYEKFKEIDEYFASDEFKKSYFGTVKGYKYQPIIRMRRLEKLAEGQDEDDFPLDENNSQISIKAKLDVSADKDGNVTSYNTMVFTKNSEDAIDYSNMTELRALIPGNSEMKALIHFQKFYIMLKKEEGAQKYGFTLKIKQINILSEQSANVSLSSFAFVDDDKEESTTKQMAKAVLEDSDDEDKQESDKEASDKEGSDKEASGKEDSEQDSDEEPEPPKVVKAEPPKTGKKVVKKVAKA